MKRAVTLMIVTYFLCNTVAMPQVCALSVKRIVPIKHYGKSLDWSRSNNRIASAKRGDHGFFTLFTMDPDGGYEEVIHNGKEGCPPKHNGNPAWHPSGMFLIFTAQNEDAIGDEAHRFGVPGTGMNCNLWLARADGKRFWPLTKNQTRFVNTPAIIHPQFSHDGRTVMWAERSGDGGGRWGTWELKIAKFAFDNNIPSLGTVTTHNPAPHGAFFESHDFSPDDTMILFSGNPVRGQAEYGLDIYVMDLRTNKLTQLTNTLHDWDEHAHYSPDGAYIAWMSSTGFDIEWGDISGHNWRKYLRSELWIMNADGSRKQRLTFFNDEGHEHERFLGRGSRVRCIVADNCWSPDGRSIIATIAWVNEEFPEIHGVKVVRIELET